MPTPAILSLDEFQSSFVGHFLPGHWILEYHDRTHLPKDVYISLGEVEIWEHTSQGDALFQFRPRSSDQELERSFSEAWKQEKDKDKKAERAAEFVLDQLSESMIRLGLVRPIFEIDHSHFITERKFAIIVLDTSALRDGTIRHLREQFQNVQLWAIIPTVSLMEIGERVAYMTSKDREGYKPKNNALIRFRPQVTLAPQEVKWIRDNFPTETLELAPELLRTFQGYEKGTGSDRQPDRVSINDRLILEGIKDLRRQRNLPEGVYLMSGDKDMSRLARLEGIYTIYPAAPTLQEFPDGICSVRYSLEARTYVFCSIHRFLWDLTHVFSRIRLQCLEGLQAGRAVELFYYFPTKLVNDWMVDKLEVTGLGSGLTTNLI